MGNTPLRTYIIHVLRILSLDERGTDTYKCVYIRIQMYIYIYIYVCANRQTDTDIYRCIYMYICVFRLESTSLTQDMMYHLSKRRLCIDTRAGLLRPPFFDGDRSRLVSHPSSSYSPWYLQWLFILFLLFHRLWDMYLPHPVLLVVIPTPARRVVALVQIRISVEPRRRGRIFCLSFSFSFSFSSKATHCVLW